MNSVRKRFSPGSVNYEGPIASGYASGRALSSETAGLWRAVLEPFIPCVRQLTILDLGAGSGRFSGLLASSFGARVIGVDPSRAMLAATAGQPLDRVTYVAGTAESVPLRDHSCDVAWLSHVLHHVRDRAACANELRRVIRSEGVILIRGTFSDNLDGYPTLFQFFPGARAICEDLPTTRETVTTFEQVGFVLDTHRRVRQQTCATLRAFAERTRGRADTALALLSDEEFSAGQAALELAADERSGPSPVYETVDLLVFWRSGRQVGTSPRPGSSSRADPHRKSAVNSRSTAYW
jgi:SAM-dependent methyltransferase